jgi:lipopolysaccharide export system permease protein
MNKTNNYILRNFSSIFFPIFFTLFSITSIISFIKIASASAILKISFLELVLMYTYMLPLILFFTTPIVFFAASVVSLVKLSLDSELIVLFSLGVSPSEIVKIYLKLAGLVSLVLLILSLGLIPISKQLNKSFAEEKKATASLNIESSEFGQKFAEWYIFSEKKKDEKKAFSNLIMFSNKGDDKFIFSNKASSTSVDGSLKLSLFDGKAYIVKPNEIDQINFKSMVINNSPKTELIEYSDLIKYWSKVTEDNKRLKDMVIYILISIFPMVSVFLIVMLGVVNPRFTKNRSTLYMVTSIFIYFALVFVLAPKLNAWLLLVLPALWIASTFYLFKQNTLSRF